MRSIRAYAVMALLTICLAGIAMGFDVQAAPGKVSGLKQTDDTSNSVTLRWNAASGSIEKYRIAVSKDASFSVSATENYVTRSSSPSCIIPSRQAGTSYYVRVTPVDVDGTLGTPSDVLEAVTAPSAQLAGFKQKKAEKAAVTMGWKKVKGANGYSLSYGISAGNLKTKWVGSQTQLRLSGLKKNAKYLLYLSPARKSASGYVAVGESRAQALASTLPAKVSGVRFISGGSNTSPRAGQLYVSWNQSAAADGYQYEISAYNSKKVICKGEVLSWKKTMILQNSKLTGFASSFLRIRVRGYTVINGKKKYGSWSDYHTFAKSLDVKIARQGLDQLRASWSKVKGAKNYTVYIRESFSSVYRKLGTTNDTSYVISKCGKSALVHGQTYYIKVVANRKSGSKTYTSDKSWYTKVFFREAW